MTKELIKINSIVALLGGLICEALGGWDVALKTLVTLVIVDYITGVIVAICNKCLSSEIGGKGIAKKGFIFALVFMAVQLDNATGTDIIRTITIMFYIANEGISILENAGKMGVPYPDKLKNILCQLKDKNDTGEEGEKHDKGNN